MSLTAEEIIRGGSRPTTTVPVCMHADLTAEHEELERQLQAALTKPRDSLAAGGNATEISERIKALEEQMREHTVVFKFQALRRPDFKKLIAEHPPRREPDGTLNERDKHLLFNVDTIFAALIRACCIEPDLSDEVWALLLDEKLTDRQFDQLSDAAWYLNRGEVDVPLSRAASRLTQDSAES